MKTFHRPLQQFKKCLTTVYCVEARGIWVMELGHCGQMEWNSATSDFLLACDVWGSQDVPLGVPFNDKTLYRCFWKPKNLSIYPGIRALAGR